MSAVRETVADNTAAGITAQLDAVWASLEELGAGLNDAEWRRPTPCPGWDVAAQYAHVIGTESSLLGRPNPQVDAGSPEHVRNQIGGFNELWVASFAARSRGEVLEVFSEVVSARRAALGAMTEEDFSAPSWTPVGQADYRRFMQIRVFDCWVHDQDVRDAVGRPGHETGPAVDQSIDELVRAAGFLVAKKAGAAPGSSVRIELTGPVERRIDVIVPPEGRARVAAIDGPPTATLELGSTAFARLCCGRVDPAAVADEGALGGVRLAGDAALARAVVENLAFTI